MIPVTVLAQRQLWSAEPGLCRALGVPDSCPCLGLITTDCDDATYIALDEATKSAQVTVCFGSSFYGGAANASTPNAGEVLGILAAPDPASLESAMTKVKNSLLQIGFILAGKVPYLAHTVSSCGSFLAREANVEPGSSLAYLIAPPLESLFALDAAMKAADVKLCKFYAPPSPTNFGGGLLSGSQSACQAACRAFAAAVEAVAAQPKGEDHNGIG